MRHFISMDYSGRPSLIYSSIASKKHFDTRRDMFGHYTVMTYSLFFISPIFLISTIFIFMYKYYREFYSLFFKNSHIKSAYKDLLAPMLSPHLFSAVGYRVYPEELEEHLQIINSEYGEDKKKLIQKGIRMKGDLSRQYGFSLDKLCRHVFFLGTTGAGKSETIMAFFTDVIRNGGASGFVDGKGDITMEGRIYNLCREEYFETQFNVINFTVPENSPDTNTYSQLLSFSSSTKTAEFLNEFIGGAGDGNDHFKNRSKVMLANVVHSFKNRQKYYNETFSISDVSQGSDHIELTNIYTLSYGLCVEIEEIITTRMANSRRFREAMKKATNGLKIPKYEEIEHLEQLVEYLNQNPMMIHIIEKEINLKMDFFQNYFILFSHIEGYIKETSPSWYKYTLAIAKATYELMVKKRKKYLYTSDNFVSMRDIRFAYISFKRADADFEYVLKLLPPDIQANLKEACGLVENAPESLERINNDSIIQHQYAMQGWGRVFSLFATYQRIMGSPYPEIDGEDIVKNGKVLFVMLPATELAGDQVEALGKLIILFFKNIASLALGGDKQSATSVQFKIFQHKIKPTPIYLMVLDEIGSYMPSKIVSLIASQVRSLQISLIISGQDTVSIEPDGADGKREKARLMANLAKIVLQTRDTDTLELEKLIPEVEVIETDSYVKSVTSHEVIATEGGTIKKVKTFDMGNATRFVKGFGVHLDSARKEPIYFQSYYLGDNIKYALQIRNKNAFINEYREFQPKLVA